MILASFLCIGIFLVFVGGSHGSAIIEGGRRSVSELQDELELAEKFQTVTGIRDPKCKKSIFRVKGRI